MDTHCIDALGGTVSVARMTGVSAPSVTGWRKRGIPPDRCPIIEQHTDGRVPVEELRPDVRWVRVPDPAWPNPAGRPCHDYAGPAQIGAPPSDPQAEAPTALPPPQAQEVIDAPAAS